MAVNKNLGFTIIELLVVISIVILFSGLSIGYYNSFTQKQNLERGQQLLLNTLELAQKKASVGDLTPDISCQNFVGYRVNFPDTVSFNLQFCCNEDSLLPDDGSCSNITGASYQLPQNLILSGVITYPYAVRFKQNGQGVSMQNVVVGKIVLKNSVTSQCLGINISDFGVTTPDTAVISC